MIHFGPSWCFACLSLLQSISWDLGCEFLYFVISGRLFYHNSVLMEILSTPVWDHFFLYEHGVLQWKVNMGRRNGLFLPYIGSDRRHLFFLILTLQSRIELYISHLYCGYDLPNLTLLNIHILQLHLLQFIYLFSKSWIRFTSNSQICYSRVASIKSLSSSKDSFPWFSIRAELGEFCNIAISSS